MGRQSQEIYSIFMGLRQGNGDTSINIFTPPPSLEEEGKRALKFQEELKHRSQENLALIPS
ncbi:unnamed protein product [Prunus armeniaca]